MQVRVSVSIVSECYVRNFKKSMAPEMFQEIVGFTENYPNIFLAAKVNRIFFL